jgi:hypothetical protein
VAVNIMVSITGNSTRIEPKVMVEIMAVAGTVIMACTEHGTTTVVAAAGVIITRV